MPPSLCTPPRPLSAPWRGAQAQAVPPLEHVTSAESLAEALAAAAANETAVVGVASAAEHPAAAERPIGPKDEPAPPPRAQGAGGGGVAAAMAAAVNSWRSV